MSGNVCIASLMLLNEFLMQMLYCDKAVMFKPLHLFYLSSLQYCLIPFKIELIFIGFSNTKYY